MNCITNHVSNQRDSDFYHIALIFVENFSGGFGSFTTVKRKKKAPKSLFSHRIVKNNLMMNL